MPDFFPFPGLRFAPDALGVPLERLTAPPYDVIDAEARARLEATDPHNAVHLILPRDAVAGDRYGRAAGLFERWCGDGTLVADGDRFYVYSMEFDEGGEARTTLGVVGSLRLSPPEDGAVLPHERTMPRPRGDRLELLRAVRANLDPVWCLSLADGLSDVLIPDGEAVASCVEDGVRHRLFHLDPDRVADVTRLVASAPAVIADGHHRYETALAYQAEAGDGGAGASGAGSIMTLMVELAPEHLAVAAIHRVFPSGPDDLRRRLAGSCEVRPFSPGVPDDVGAVLAAMEAEEAMALVDAEGTALVLPRHEILDARLDHLPPSLRTVDSARLEAALAESGVYAEITFQHDPVTAVAEVAKGEAAAVVLIRPVSVEHIAAVAATGVRMPEKSTFFRPKPLTGMIFRTLGPR